MRCSLYVGCGRNRLAIARTFGIGATPEYLEVWIGALAVQELARAGRHARVHGRSFMLFVLVLVLVWLLLLLLLLLKDLRIRRGEIRLTVLEMLNLASRVLCAHKAAVETAYFVAFGGGVLVLELCKGTSDLCSVGVSMCVSLAMPHAPGQSVHRD